MTPTTQQFVDFHSVLAASGRSPEIADPADLYGWLCGSWELDVLHYRGIDVRDHALKGEVHAGCLADLVDQSGARSS